MARISRFASMLSRQDAMDTALWRASGKSDRVGQLIKAMNLTNAHEGYIHPTTPYTDFLGWLAKHSAEVVAGTDPSGQVYGLQCSATGFTWSTAELFFSFQYYGWNEGSSVTIEHRMDGCDDGSLTPDEYWEEVIVLTD